MGALALMGVAIRLALPSSGGHHAAVEVYRTSPAHGAPPAAPVESDVLSAPEGLAVSPDGDLLIDNQGTNQILRRNASGELKVLAGDGRPGFGGDGGAATRAELDRPDAVAAGPDGTVYVADTGNNRIRAISPTGIITTVAGDGSTRGPSSGPARRVVVADPTSVAVGRLGRIYFTDEAGVQVLQGGLLRTVSLAGQLLIRGTPMAWSPHEIAVSGTGVLYVADESPKVLVELSPAGSVLHVLYGGPSEEGSFRYRGEVAPSADVSGLAAAGGGSMALADYATASVESIIDGSVFRTGSMFTRNDIYGLGGTFRPSGIAVAKDGTVYLATDGRNGGTDRPALVELSGGPPQLLGGPAPAEPPALRLRGIGATRFGQSELRVVAVVEAELGPRAFIYNGPMTVTCGGPAVPIRVSGGLPVILYFDEENRFDGYDSSIPSLRLGRLHVGMTVAAAHRIFGDAFTTDSMDDYHLHIDGGVVDGNLYQAREGGVAGAVTVSAIHAGRSACPMDSDGT